MIEANNVLFVDIVSATRFNPVDHFYLLVVPACAVAGKLFGAPRYRPHGIRL
jgi:hypothetical protein